MLVEFLSKLKEKLVGQATESSTSEPSNSSQATGETTQKQESLLSKVEEKVTVYTDKFVDLLVRVRQPNTHKSTTETASSAVTDNSGVKSAGNSKTKSKVRSFFKKVDKKIVDYTESATGTATHLFSEFRGVFKKEEKPNTGETGNDTPASPSLVEQVENTVIDYAKKAKDFFSLSKNSSATSSPVAEPSSRKEACAKEEVTVAQSAVEPSKFGTEPVSKPKEEATKFVGGGSLVGALVAAKVGGIGLIIAGSSITIGFVPVAIFGAVTGLAAYGAKRAFFDKSSKELPVAVVEPEK